MTVVEPIPSNFPEQDPTRIPEFLSVSAPLGALSTRGSFIPTPRNADLEALPTEKYQIGYIAEVQPQIPEDYGFTAETSPAEIYEVAVTDPYVEEYDLETRLEIMEIEAAASEYACARREAGMWERKTGTAYTDADDNQYTKTVWGDPESTSWFFDGILKSEGMRVWRSEIIPSALALTYLADPKDQVSVISKKDGKAYPIDEESRAWWTLCTDGVAIRSRGTVMAELVKEYASKRVDEGADANSLRMMSIACGTALPTMKAAVHTGIAPRLTLLDFDRTAMNATEILADEIGFKGEITKKGMNIFDGDKMAQMKAELEAKGELPDVVDMMGIFEYTGENLGIDPAPFLRSGYDMVAPGGTLIFGQMRDKRPVEDFTMGVVAWPHVEQRSPAELMNIILAAGIPKESVRMFMPTDSVYTVVSVSKPADS